ncbi:hypothetical protein Vi05172_g1442 [Venturia inaequalis]|nr:hypothetical protein Vi05172_g1442 [Venturia inaequalis]
MCTQEILIWTCPHPNQTGLLIPCGSQIGNENDHWIIKADRMMDRVCPECDSIAVLSGKGGFGDMSIKE